ncbi:hypothetical protein GLYMA_11G196250v4 [Glycine max]|nr:hypothetical protein GLYMA_11G196250v4 [Glycine max]KAH1159429.1 hypothetical protein GYH30_031237 [Glycine max]
MFHMLLLLSPQIFWFRRVEEETVTESEIRRNKKDKRKKLWNEEGEKNGPQMLEFHPTHESRDQRHTL